MAEEFIRNSAEFACKLAKHRGQDTLERDDVRFAIERLYHIQMPATKSSASTVTATGGGQITGQTTNAISTANYKANQMLVKKANE